MPAMKLSLAAALALTLAACGGQQPASVKGGSCKVMVRAQVEACGISQADQNYIDDTIEAGVSACRFTRPAARTPSCAVLRRQIAEDRRNLQLLRSGMQPAPSAPAKKPGLWSRVRSRLAPKR